MKVLEPTTSREAADMLKFAAVSKQRLVTGGHFSKKLMAGPVDSAATLTLTTARLNRVLKYEPRDLTLSVQAGMPFRELDNLLRRNRQMIPLDPMYSEHCTVGGVVAANTSGPRRRQYGTARDFVIGMQFALLNGRLVDTGGMVVKNVAGLDLGKIMIGSFGTLGLITSVNFKVVPLPPAERTFAISFATCPAALEARDKLIRGPLQPSAIDLLNPAMALQENLSDWTLLLRFGGNEALMERCEKEMLAIGDARTGTAAFWQNIQNLTPRFLATYSDGAIVRISCALDRVGAIMETLDAPAIARAGTGVIYAFFIRSSSAGMWTSQKAVPGGINAVVEFASDSARRHLNLWPEPGSDFAIMERIKRMFDPELLMNRGRLYRRL
jgi:glycolate oxidase FAD binding subunit